MITTGPMNVTVCSGTKANLSCSYTGVYDPFSIIPNWKTSVINHVKISKNDIKHDKSANKSYLSVGPVDDTYNNTSYQCIFTINDNIIESDTAGTITVIGMYVNMYIYTHT